MAESYHEIVNLLSRQDFDENDKITLGAELTLASPSGFTLLHWAVLKKRVIAVKKLMECNAPMKKDRNGNTPVHWASILGHDIILNALLDPLDDENKTILVICLIFDTF
jgi:ankyrin repeat protein